MTALDLSIRLWKMGTPLLSCTSPSRREASVRPEQGYVCCRWSKAAFLQVWSLDQLQLRHLHTCWKCNLGAHLRGRGAVSPARGADACPVWWLLLQALFHTSRGVDVNFLSGRREPLLGAGRRIQPFRKGSLLRTGPRSCPFPLPRTFNNRTAVVVAGDACLCAPWPRHGVQWFTFIH